MRSYPEFHSVEPNGTRAGQDPLETPLMAMPNRHRGHGNGRLAAKQGRRGRAGLVRESSVPFLGSDIIAAAGPSVSGAWATAAASRLSEIASSRTCMPAKDVPHAMI